MAEQTADEAFKRAIAEARDGAKDAPRKDVDPTISDTMVGKHREYFLKVFRRNFDAEGGVKKWADERDDALRMARYIGVLAIFWAEAHKKNAITDEGLAWAIDKVKKECEIERDSVATPHDKREVWCS